MKLCLAIMCRDEAPLLRLHAPIWTQAAFDGWIALDGHSQDDTVSVCQSFGFTVFPQQTEFPPCAWENELVEQVEAAGYSHIFRLDVDELIFPEQIEVVRRLLETEADALWFPRYNFVGDRLHYADYSPFYPDPQLKAWKLGCGVRYQKDMDSVPNATECGLRTRYCTDIHLFHYSFAKPPAEYYRRRVPLERRMRGEVYEGYQPPDDAAYSITPVPFTGQQPLDPMVIGANAPYA